MKIICMNCTWDFRGITNDACPNCESKNTVPFLKGKKFTCYNSLKLKHERLTIEQILYACESFLEIKDKFTGVHKIFLIEGNHNLNYFRGVKKMGFQIENNVYFMGEPSLSIDYEVQ